MAPKHELVRFAARGQRAVIDRRAVLPGRGAYLCCGEGTDLPAADCLELARRRGGFPRALRCSVQVDAEFVESISG